MDTHRNEKYLPRGGCVLYEEGLIEEERISLRVHFRRRSRRYTVIFQAGEGIRFAA